MNHRPQSNMRGRAARRRRNRKSFLERLEPRMLLDADGPSELFVTQDITDVLSELVEQTTEQSFRVEQHGIQLTLSHTTGTIAEAKEDARSRDAILFEPRTPELHSIGRELFGTYHVWIGAERGGDHRFRWPSDGAVITFGAWHHNGSHSEPNSINERSVESYAGSHEWNDVRGGDRRIHWILQQRIPDEPQIESLHFEHDSSGRSGEFVIDVTETNSTRVVALEAHSSIQYAVIPDGQQQVRIPFQFSVGGPQLVSAVAANSSGVGQPLTQSLTLPNDTPSPSADDFATHEDEVLIVPAFLGLLSNDSDPDGDALSVSVAESPSKGTLRLEEDGAFQYEPHDNQFGSDHFVYRVTDGVDEQLQRVTLLVQPRNDSPNAVDDVFSLVEDSAVSGVSVLENDSDIDGDTLTAHIVDPPEHGQVQLEPDGTLLYQPDANFFGTDEFTYQAIDAAGESAQATVSLLVRSENDHPVSVSDSYQTAEDEVLIVSASLGLLSNDSDADGDALSVSVAESPSKGTLRLEEDGAFQYEPHDNQFGSDHFVYRVTDGVDEQLQRVTLLVQPRNDSPNAVDDVFSLVEDSAVSGVSVLENDSDIDGDTLTAHIVDPPEHGQVQLEPDGTLLYQPDANFFGTDEFTYQAIDAAGESAQATVSLLVRSENDHPVSVSDSYQTAEDEVLIVSASLGLLSNDSDADGDALSVSVVESPSKGTLRLEEDGAFQYEPHDNQFGSDHFVYRVTDGVDEQLQRVTLLVQPRNDSPNAVDDVFSLVEDSAVSGVSVLENDSDIDGDTLTAHIVDPPEHGRVTLSSDGHFNYTPNPDFFGSDAFTYRAVDDYGTESLGMALLLISSVGDRPILNEDRYETAEDETLIVSASLGLLSNDSDADGDTLSVSVAESPTKGTLRLEEDGAFQYEPHDNHFGSDHFVYRVTDGVDEQLQRVTLRVQPRNDSPNAVDDVFSLVEDSALSGVSALENDSDIDGDTLTAHLVEPPEHGQVHLESDGTLLYQPDANFFGTDEFTYQAIDAAGESAQATVSLLVRSENDHPVSVSDSYQTAEDETLIVSASRGLLSNDFDADGDALSVSLAEGPTKGTLRLEEDGAFQYEPHDNHFGSDHFVYRVTDGVDEQLQRVTLLVQPRTRIAMNGFTVTNAEHTQQLGEYGTHAQPSENTAAGTPNLSTTGPLSLEEEWAHIVSSIQQFSAASDNPVAAQLIGVAERAAANLELRESEFIREVFMHFIERLDGENFFEYVTDFLVQLPRDIVVVRTPFATITSGDVITGVAGAEHMMIELSPAFDEVIQHQLREARPDEVEALAQQIRDVHEIFLREAVVPTLATLEEAGHISSFGSFAARLVVPMVAREFRNRAIASVVPSHSPQLANAGILAFAAVASATYGQHFLVDGYLTEDFYHRVLTPRLGEPSGHETSVNYNEFTVSTNTSTKWVATRHVRAEDSDAFPKSKKGGLGGLLGLVGIVLGVITLGPLIGAGATSFAGTSGGSLAGGVIGSSTSFVGAGAVAGAQAAVSQTAVYSVAVSEGASWVYIVVP